MAIGFEAMYVLAVRAPSSNDGIALVKVVFAIAAERPVIKLPRCAVILNLLGA